jgi:mRNA interferase MazF
VQGDELGEATMAVLVCPITSEITEGLPIRPIVEVTEGNGLHSRSQIMTDRMLAVPRDRVRQVIGTVDKLTSDLLDAALLIVLGLAR